MDASDGRPSPRSRQLQGPRPPRLAVSKDSHKVRKPPVVPQPRGGGGVVAGPSRPQQQQQPRAPVIIYDASPKFQLPQEFMLSPTAALSPAARYAAIERSVRPLPPTTAHYYTADADDPILLDVDGDAAAFAAALGPARPSILSPVPSALPPAASSGLFSPLDQASLSWLSDLSPFLHSAGAAAAPPPPFAPSPRSLLLSTPTMPSPATFSVMEFFSSNFPDL
ncbi:hypothetical protein OsJ_07046 [Oryza sativa Japonica Group]|uniref:Uncharacterized protein n=1 Tax=Oryza sativa subsp. japonica TaxID=39947 RepID=A3A7R1_ORYSJ|nr:hypothetical protein OsJ_07046 [Oryza sativa Japonica Group]